nr:MAG TPA: hypothetical protein [Caudoviricetes sp.]
MLIKHKELINFWNAINIEYRHFCITICCTF